MRKIRNRLADRLAPELFYLVQPSKNDNAIKRPSLREAAAYLLRTGNFPTQSRTVLVASGGAAKTYFVGGLVGELIQNGITIDEFFVTSGSAFLALSEFRDYGFVRDFAYKVPDLIEKIPNREWYLANISPPLVRTIYENGVRVLVPRNRRADSSKKNGDSQKNNNWYRTDKLEERLGKLCEGINAGDLKKFNIIATDYCDGKPYTLNRDFPDMPLEMAIRASIAIPDVMPSVYYKDNQGIDHLFVDGGVAWHLPLIKKQVSPDTTTVLGVWLSSQVARWNRLNYHRIEGLYASWIRQSEISDGVKIPNLISSFIEGIEPDELVARGDYNSQRLLLLTPHFPDIPSYEIHIPLKRRKSLFNEGVEEARRLMKAFRRPIQIPRAQMPSFDPIREYFQSFRNIGS